jgi:hypothetical protein
LPLSILAQPQTINAIRIDLILIEKQSLKQSLISQSQANHHRIERVICQFTPDKIIVIHTIDECVALIYIGGSTPVIDRFIY